MHDLLKSWRAVGFAAVCFAALPALAGPVEDELMAADKAFSQLSAEKGVPAAFLATIADDVRLFGTSGEPLVGRAKVAAHYASPEFLATKPNETALTWAPLEAFASADGTLGWTNGHWKRVSPPDKGGQRSESTGHYVTVWRKGPQGWKVVTDIGTTDPVVPPKSK